jgi:hypothetical protein
MQLPRLHLALTSPAVPAPLQMWFNLYANAKPAVRVAAPGVWQHGPHFFMGEKKAPDWVAPDNPKGAWRHHLLPNAMLLHYAYSYQSDVAAKAGRSCGPGNGHLEAALKGNATALAECFIIGIDRDAYIAAARGPAAVEDFFYSRMVLSEGAPVRWGAGWV